MKKILFLTLLAFASLSFATTIRVSGLEKISSPVVEMKYAVSRGKCSILSDYHCNTSSLTLGGSVESVKGWISDFNAQFGSDKLVKSILNGDSTISLRFANYPSTCHVILSNKSNVSISINKDGSCSSS